MPKKLLQRFFLLSLMLLISRTNSSKAAGYTMQLTAADWKMQVKNFHISGVTDLRKDKSNGFTLLKGQKSQIVFSSSIENELLQYLRSGLDQDTGTAPVIAGIELFTFSESGSMQKHTLNLKLKIKYYREHAGKQIAIYEVESNPSYQLGGPVPFAPEKLLNLGLKSAMESFSKAIQESPDMAQLAMSTKVIFEPLTEALRRNTDTICWSPGLKLKWSDFRGPVQASPFSAESNCVFNYTAFTKMTGSVLEIHITMYASFNCQSSWVKPELKRDTLLLHEQLHFDICEREIRKLKHVLSLKSLDPFDFEEQIHNAFNEHWTNYMNLQRQYDEETNHGMIIDKQLEWVKSVSEDLLKSEE